ncbi:MAG TPA: hypothetical protein VFU15_01510 [Bacteroidia bacterium]|nr:hypothetical protein [Bacteroidia bacterium]
MKKGTGNGVVQLGKYNKKKKKKDGKSKVLHQHTLKPSVAATMKVSPSFSKALTSGEHEEDIFNSMKTSIETQITKSGSLQKEMEDDEDIDFIEENTAQLSIVLLQAKNTLEEIKKRPYQRFRSKDKVRAAYVNKLHELNNRQRILINELKRQFPTHKGGFGAKGRAHAMAVEIDPTDVPMTKVEDNSFVSNIKLDKVALNAKVYKEELKVGKEAAGPIKIMGKDATAYKKFSKKKVLADVEKPMSPVESSQKVTLKDAPAGKARGQGQYANMNNTNAAGYAWLINAPGMNSQRWEWLHVRGAGLGGATDSTNLVTGTRDINTQMIPFESNIRQLGAIVKKYPNKYKEFKVDWAVAKQYEGAAHAFSEISIDWKLINKSGADATSGHVAFNPMHTASNISKDEVNLLENKLKEKRDSVDH